MLRFSFLGESGWKSGFSQSPEALFNEERLKLRLQLLQSLPLASLAAQSDRGFHLFVLTAKDLPQWAQTELRSLCAAALPEGNFTVWTRPPGPAGVFLRRFLTRRFGTNRCFQVVLDDDDALSKDFMQCLRDEMAGLSCPGPGDLRFVSFANGYALDISDFSQARLRLYKHRYPFINLGLAMIGQPGGRNLLTIAHRKVPRRHEHALVSSSKQMFVRCVHSGNDSRVAVNGGWKEVLNWRGQRDIRRRFRFLAQL